MHRPDDEDRRSVTDETAPGSTGQTGRDPYLLAQVREAFGRVVYSHKTREKQADICFTKHRLQQGVLVALTAISSGTFLVAVVGLLGNPVLASLTTSSIALLVTWMSLGAKTFKFADESDAHRGVATQLWDARESYISLISDLMSGGISDEQARTRRDELQEATSAAYANAPRTTAKAYTRAQEGLKHNEEMTFTPREIDLFLPEALRLNRGEVRQ
ncbi:SLATT domain-containing protein [Rhodococcus sp. Eu-32]|nr:SLATT domain-containing protein [Rhodococcus sp. Eu-32]